MESRDFANSLDTAPATAGYTYRKILHVDLVEDLCDVLKSDLGGWQPGEGRLSQQLERFARGGAVHPEDVERFAAFTRPEYLRFALRGREDALPLLYRRREKDAYRWNLMEAIPDRTEGGEVLSATLCVKDIHDAMWEGVKREGVGVRSQELIRSLGEQSFNIYTINLDTGTADPVRVDGRMREGAAPLALPWDPLLEEQVADRLHESYRDALRQQFSLEGLRRARESGQAKAELLCQMRSGEDYRYIAVTAHFGQEPKARSFTILALEDVDERMRRELSHTLRDMQMAAILKSRFKVMNTVDLETGVCERVDLSRPAGPENTLTGDYAHFIRLALERVVHPDDAEEYARVLSLEHLRETAEATLDFEEEVCLYRQRGEPVTWIELRVIYTRQKGSVMVNILGQDVTRTKLREESRLQALKDRAYIISSLSSLFFSTYYIDLEHDSFRAVIQLRRVEDVLGEEVNYTAALQIYANHFIHPDDRAEYLRVMGLENLRETLRWWQPCVAMEYRKAPEDPTSGPDACGWVRATAVLAQTGGDDMPKTVVYVAQDISGNRRRTSDF